MGVCRGCAIVLVLGASLNVLGCAPDPGGALASDAPGAQALSEGDGDDVDCGALPRTVSGFSVPESAYWDADSRSWYVSNMAGSPIEKDGVGWISKLDACGDVVEAQWVSGLDAPKGIRVARGKMYVGDMDQLVVIDMATRAVTKIPAPGAVLLNDPDVAEDGSVFIADTFTNAVYRFADGAAEVFVSSPLLDFPNGLIIDRGDVVVASSGTLAPPFTLGKLWRIDRRTRAMSPIGTFEAKMDGIERFEGGYLISETGTSLVYQVTKHGSSVLHAFAPDGLSAINDIGLDPQRRLLAVPAYLEGTVTFYPLGE